MGTIAKITAGGTTHLVASSAYGTCSTAAATVAKVVTMSDFDTLINGMTIHVYFTYSNTAANPTLNVNSKGSKPIYKYGTTVPGKTAETSWQAGSIVSFTYNTTANSNGCWIMNDHLDDNNTTYTPTTTSIGSASAGTAIPADDITAWTTNTPTVVVPATVVTGGTTASITPVTKKTVVTGGSTVSITPVTSKTVVTGGTTTSITPVTAKTVVTSASGATASVSEGVLTLTSGSFGTGDSVIAGTAINAYTGLTTGASVNTGTAQTVVSGLTTGDSVTTGTAVTVYKSLTTGSAASVTAGTAASLSYTAKTIPNISVSPVTVVTDID